MKNIIYSGPLLFNSKSFLAPLLCFDGLNLEDLGHKRQLLENRLVILGKPQALRGQLEEICVKLSSVIVLQPRSLLLALVLFVPKLDGLCTAQVVALLATISYGSI